MIHGFFITGTDTGVGKTRAALGLIEAWRRRGFTAAGMKPVATGCLPETEGLRNDDAQRLRAQSSVPLPYEWVNPYAFEPPVSPHIAAAEAGVRIELAHIERCFAEIAQRADVVVVEGIGGWLVPLDERHTTADMARVLGLPLILVVGVRLGCLNHALLTCEQIRARGIPLAAWAANVIDAGCLRIPQIIATLESRLPAPLLGVIPFLASPEPGAVAACLALDRLGVDKTH